MNNEDFYRALTEILDVDAVKAEDILRDFSEWDSLTVLSVLAMADSNYGVTITPEDIRSVVTAGDLATLVDIRQK